MSDEAGRAVSHRRPRQRAPQMRALSKIDRVLAATIYILEREGEPGVRIASIAESCGVSYGVIYHHFGDRDGLIRAAQMLRLRSQPGGDLADLAAATDMADDTGEFLERVMAICRNIADPERARVRLIRTQVIAGAATDPELHQEFRRLETEIHDEFTALIRSLQAKGLAAADLDAAAVAVVIEAIAYGVVLGEFMDNRPTPEQLAPALMRAILAFAVTG